MSYQIKKSSTAYPLVFMMIDSFDHINGKIGLSPIVTISKAGAPFVTPSGTVTEIGAGWYKVAGNATDSNTIGPLVLHANATGADPTDIVFDVIADALAAAEIADAVWDEVLSGHVTAGSTGNVLNTAGLAGDPWATAFPGTYGAGTAGYAMNAIKAKTDNLPPDPADASDIAANFLTANNLLNSIQGDTNDLQMRVPVALIGGRMDCNISSINNSATTMASFQRAVKGNVIGTVGAGSTATSIVTSSLTPTGSVADKFKGRMIIFSDDTPTVNLRGQATDITANTSATAPTLTVTALTTAPASGDYFVIV